MVLVQLGEVDRRLAACAGNVRAVELLGDEDDVALEVTVSTVFGMHVVPANEPTGLERRRPCDFVLLCVSVKALGAKPLLVEVVQQVAVDL